MSKTGSSAIQSWLSLNVSNLKQQGVYYADLSPSAKYGKITAGNGVALFHACTEENWDEVERLIANVYLSQSMKALISSETLQGISENSIKKIAEICEKLAIEVNVIAYARSVYELLYSNYLQGIKRHGFTFDFGKREKLSYRSQRTSLQNYHNVFYKRLKLINYDSVSKDIFSSFASYVGFDPSKLRVKDKKVNRSLTFIESQVLLDMNRIHGGEFSTEISDYLIEKEPKKVTAVFYDNNLIEDVTANTTEDLQWINETIIPIGGAIQISKVPDKVVNKSVGDYGEILDIVIEWSLQYESTEKLIALVEFLRDFAVSLEDSYIEKSLLLMTRAKMLRPNGPFILKRIELYNEKIAGKNRDQ